MCCCARTPGNRVKWHVYANALGRSVTLVSHWAGNLLHLHDCSRMATKVKVNCSLTDSAEVCRDNVQGLQSCTCYIGGLLSLLGCKCAWLRQRCTCAWPTTRMGDSKYNVQTDPGWQCLTGFTLHTHSTSNPVVYSLRASQANQHHSLQQIYA